MDDKNSTEDNSSRRDKKDSKPSFSEYLRSLARGNNSKLEQNQLLLSPKELMGELSAYYDNHFPMPNNNISRLRPPLPPSLHGVVDTDLGRSD